MKSYKINGFSYFYIFWPTVLFLKNIFSYLYAYLFQLISIKTNKNMFNTFLKSMATLLILKDCNFNLVSHTTIY